MQQRERSPLAGQLEAQMNNLLACIHCGICLSSCPTFMHLGDENDSPRGRLYLMRAVAEKRIAPTSAAFTRHIDICLGCRACETVCPSGVRYGLLLETARQEIAHRSRGRGWRDRALRLALNKIFISPRRLRAFFALARRLRQSSFLTIALEAGVLASLPPAVQQGLMMLLVSKPQETTPGSSDPRPARQSDSEPGRGAPPAPTALFAGCVVRELFGHTNEATRRVLSENGCRVTDPPDQVCCGALHAHAGELETARTLARKNIEAFETGAGEAIIVNAAGCGAMLKQYAQLLADDGAYHRRAERFSKRVKDISEILVQRGFEPGKRSLNLRVTYDAPCHLHHGQRVTQAPLQLIEQLPGVEYVELPEMDVCCGSAGVYNLLHPEMAEQILSSKLDRIGETGADVLLTGNAGCLMHLGSGMRMRGSAIVVMHPVELMARTYE